jgi:ATP-binding cassette subfamily F protein uup
MLVPPGRAPAAAAGGNAVRYVRHPPVSLCLSSASLSSGGERKRVALAAALLRQPDVLLLDEPTNHLSIEALQWLEAELSSRSVTALVVTHDRAFLDAVCSEVLELDSSTVYRHRGSGTGTYDTYLTRKQERLEAEGKQAAAARNLLGRELAWVRRQPKARESKSKTRTRAFEELSAQVSRAGSAQRELMISAKSQRLGTATIALDDASLSVGDPARRVLSDFTYEFERRDRIGLVGPNGVGKTTLLRALLGQVPLSSGELRVGETIVWGHYAQQGLDFPPDARVLRFVQAAVATGPGGGADADRDEAAASRLLPQFLFPPSRWNERVQQLSGGERRRLQLLQVLAQQPNVLLLDEPTNDLDLDSIAVLEEFLIHEFKGVMIVCSHDRHAEIGDGIDVDVHRSQYLGEDYL